jgi:hypothetical protein
LGVLAGAVDAGVDALELSGAGRLELTGDELDLGGTSEEDGDGAAGVLVEVLDEDGHGVTAGAVLGENVLAAGDGALVEGVGHVVEGVDVLVLEGAHGVGLGAEETVLDVLEDGLAGGGGEDGAGNAVGLDVVERHDGSGLAEFEADELLVGGHASEELDGSLRDGLAGGELVVGHVGEEDDAEEVLEVLGGVPELDGHLGVLEGKSPFVQSGSLLLSNIHADLGNGESLLFVAGATLSHGRLGAGPFGHLLVAEELALDLDIHGHDAAVGSGLDLSGQLDGEGVLEEGLAADGNDVTAGLLGGVHGSLEFDAGIGLSLGVGSLDDGVTDGAELARRGDGFSGLVGGITDGEADKELAEGVLGEVEHVLDGVGGSLLEGLLDFALEFVQGLERSLLTQKGKDEGVSALVLSLGLGGFGGGRAGAGLALLADLLLDGEGLLVLLVLGADEVEPLLAFSGLGGAAGGGAGLASGAAGATTLLLFHAVARFFAGLELAGGGDALEAAGNVEDEGLGLGLSDVQDELAFDVADGGGSQPSGAQGATGRVEAGDPLGPAGEVFVFFGEVGLFLNLEVHAHVLLSEDAGVLVLFLLVLDGTDEFHLSSLRVDGGPEFVVNDGGVGLLVVGDNVDGSLGTSLAKVVGGNGELVLALGSLAGNGGEGKFNDEVTLDSSLVLLAGEGNLEGDLAVDLPGVDGGEVGLEGHLGGSTDVIELDGSADGNEGGDAHVVDEGDTHDGGHGAHVLGQVEELLVVDVVLSLVSLGSVLEELLGQLLDGFLIEGPEALDFLADVDEEGARDGRVLLAGFDVEHLADLGHLFVSLEFFLVLLVDDVQESGDQLLDGVASEGDLNGVDLAGSVSEVVEVAVVDVGGEDGVFGLEPGEVLGVSGVDGSEPFGIEEVVGAGSGGIDGLHHDVNVTGLLDLVVLDGEGSVELSKAADGGVHEGVDITVGLEPGGHGDLLPKSNIGVGAVEEEGVGGVTDFSVLTVVESDGDEEGKDLLLNDLVGEDVVGLTVDGGEELLLLGHVLAGARLDEAGKSVDGLDLDQRFGLLIHDALDDFDDIGVSEVSEGSEEGDDVVTVLFGVGFETLLQLLDEEGNELLGDVLFVAELAVEGNGEAGVLDSLVDAGLVGQVGEGEHGGGAELLLTLDGIVLNEAEVSLEELLGGGADVHGDGGKGLGGFLSVELSVLDELEQVVDGGVGSSDGQGIHEDAATDFLLFISGLDPLASDFLDSGGVQDAEGLDDGGDLGQSFALSDGVLFGGLVEVSDDFLHKLVDALLKSIALQGGDEHGAQGSFFEGGLLKESLSFGLGDVGRSADFLAGGAGLSGASGRGGLLGAVRGVGLVSFPGAGSVATGGAFLRGAAGAIEGSVLDLTVLLEFLFLGVEGVDKGGDGLGALDGSGFSLLDGQKSDVLLGSSNDLLGVTETGVETFLLGDLQDGVVTTAGSASQVAGNEGTSPKVSTGVVTRTELELGGSGVSEDGLVGAGGEVDGLDDLVDLVVVVAKLRESTGPGLLFGAGG